RPRAATSGLVPPVLDVALAELAARAAQQVLAHERGAREEERHDVLDLVAEAEGAAGLVVAGPREEAAAQRLVEQPAVHHHVEGVVRGVHLDGPQPLAPASDRLVAGGAGGAGGPRGVEAAEDVLGLGPVLPLPEQEHAAPRLAGLELDADLQGGAGIEPGSEPAGEPPAPEAGRAAQAAVAAQELPAVAR